MKPLYSIFSVLAIASAASQAWDVPNISGVYQNAVVTQKGARIQAIDISHPGCDVAMSGVWDGRRFQVKIQSRASGKVVDGVVEALLDDTLRVRLATASAVCGSGGQETGWDWVPLSMERLSAIMVPRVDSLGEGLGRQRYFGVPVSEESGFDRYHRLKDRFGIFREDESSAAEPELSVNSLEGRGEELLLSNLRVLPADSFPVPPAVVTGSKDELLPPFMVGTGNSELNRGYAVVADSGLGGWSVLQPDPQGYDGRKARFYTVSPQRATTAQISKMELEDTPLPGSFQADSAKLCAEAARISLSGWLGEVMHPSRRDSTERQIPAPESWAKLQNASLLGVFGGGLRLCLAEHRVGWRSETDSGTQLFKIPYVVVREEQGWRPLLPVMESFGLLDSSLSGHWRGIPNLSALFEELTAYMVHEDVSRLHSLALDWRRKPAANGLRLCLEPSRGRGNDCISLDTSGAVVGTPRLMKLPGWKNCLGYRCPDLDLAPVLTASKEYLSSLWSAEESRLEYKKGHSRQIDDLSDYYNTPDAPWTATVKLTKKVWTGEICFDAGPNHGCLVVDALGAVHGTGLFQAVQYSAKD